MTKDVTSPPTVGEAFFDVLRSHGVNRIFGNPGSNELTMLKYLPDDFDYMLALHEGAAVAMAEGYAHSSGSVGLVNLHSSAGAGNALGNLTNSAAGHAPLVVLSGQQSRKYVPLTAMLTNVDATKLYDPLVKWAGEALRPEDTPLLVSKALMLAAAAPSGPVYLSVPLDDWSKPGDTATLSHLISRRVSGDPVVGAESLDVLIAALDESRNPALVLGPGVDDTRGWSAAVRLADARGIPVWVAPSPPRAPFPTRHGRFRGVLPTGLGALSDELAGHDLVLTFGAAVFRYHQFVDGAMLPDGARLMGVTSDPDEAARAAMGTLLVGDPSDALERVAAAQRGIPPSTAEPLAVEPAGASEAPFAAEAILDAVDRAKSPETVVVLEWTSADSLWPRLSFDRPQSYYFPASGGLGWGMPAAIGVALGDPTRPVVALIGDGAMQYTPSALWTAARYSIPVSFVVCQNREYGALRRFAGIMDVPHATYLDIPDLDPALIARGYGVDAVQIQDLDDLEAFIREGVDARGPRLAVVPQRPMP